MMNGRPLCSVSLSTSYTTTSILLMKEKCSTEGDLAKAPLVPHAMSSRRTSSCAYTACPGSIAPTFMIVLWSILLK
jgi:hypothetical protein